MDFLSPPVVTQALSRRIQAGLFGYEFVHQGLVDAIADWSKKRHHWNIPREWIYFFPGVVPSLHFFIRFFTEPKDEVLTFTPIYPPFLEMDKNHPIILRQVPLEKGENRYFMDLDRLVDTLNDRSRVLLLSNPQNPTGEVYSREELEALGEVCRKHNLVILSDEIWSDLVWERHVHVPIASLNEDLAQRTITLSSPNKAFNIPGLGTSYVVCANREWRSALERYTERSLPPPHTLGMVAMETAYVQGRDWLMAVKAYLEKNIDLCHSFLGSEWPEIEYFRPKGTFLLWLNFQKAGIGGEPARFLFEKGKIALSAGADFGEAYKDYTRFNFATPRSLLEEGLERLVSCRR